MRQVGYFFTRLSTHGISYKSFPGEGSTFIRFLRGGMKPYLQRVREASDFLKARIGHPIALGIMTGTGLGESVAGLAISASLDYTEIPHFPRSTVESHYGMLIAGSLEGVSVVAMQGRFHLYEGYAPSAVVFPVRVMQELGVRTLILCNAAGGLNPAFSSGDIMGIADHINLTGENPLIGPNEEAWGIRFPDMTAVYDPVLTGLAEQTGRSGGFPVHRGVYGALKGPSLEPPAETRYLSRIGADAVGFSTVLEAIAGVHAGMRILGLSTITNIHDPDRPKPHTVEEIIAVAEKAAFKHSAIMTFVARELKINGGI